MSKIEKAIAVMQQHKCEEIALYGDEYNLAIFALREKQERGKGCEYCREERGVHKAQSVDCWRIDESAETREKFASKFCGNCGRDLRKSENDE